MQWNGLFGDKLELAIRLTALKHQGQQRRGSCVPYAAHPFAVAWILDRAGFAESVVIAGLSHDLIEDTATSETEIHESFGPEVAVTVRECSESKVDSSGRPRPWEDRKQNHLQALKVASSATKAVVLADKLHNLMSIRLDLLAGRSVWDQFHAERDRVLWYFGAVIDSCQSDDPRLLTLAAACRDELMQLIQLG